MRALRAIFKAVRSPGAIVPLVILCTIDLLSLPRTTTAGRVVTSLTSGSRTPHPAVRPRVYRVQRTTDGIEVVDDVSSQGIASVIAYSVQFESGFWAPTRSNHNVEFDLYAPYLALTPDEADQIRLQFADHLDEQHASDLAARVRRSEWTRSRVLPLGMLHNTISLCLFGALALSLVGGVRAVRHACRDDTRRKRLRCGFCPRCEYSIVGLASPVCPECGEALPETAGIRGDHSGE